RLQEQALGRFFERDGRPLVASLEKRRAARDSQSPANLLVAAVTFQTPRFQNRLDFGSEEFELFGCELCRFCSRFLDRLCGILSNAKAGCQRGYQSDRA